MTDSGSDSDRDRNPANRGYRRLFDGDLTVGLSFPITTDEDPLPSEGFDDQFGRAQYAADLGFDALWVRDVPTYWPEFGDAGQIHDPFVYLSGVAARTEDVALGTASVALPLRHPLHVAKATASIDRLSEGRLVLGVGTGDRPPEYAAFGVDREARGERFRESVRVLRAAWSEAFPEVETSQCRLEGDLDVVPKPETGTVPLLVTGRSRQSLEWIAERGDGWLNYQFPLDTLEATVGDWRAATDRPTQALRGDAGRPPRPRPDGRRDADPPGVRCGRRLVPRAVSRARGSRRRSRDRELPGRRPADPGRPRGVRHGRARRGVTRYHRRAVDRSVTDRSEGFRFSRHRAYAITAQYVLCGRCPGPDWNGNRTRGRPPGRPPRPGKLLSGRGNRGARSPAARTTPVSSGRLMEFGIAASGLPEEYRYEG